MKRNLLLNLTNYYQQKITKSLFSFVSLALLVIFSLTSVKAQSVINDYSFAQTIGPAYANITGATSVVGGAGTNGFGNPGGASFQSINATANIGFNFVFNSVSYSQLVISDNGFVTFGTAPAQLPGTTSNPINNAGTYFGAIAGFGGNLVGNYQDAVSATYFNSGSDISYKTDTSGGVGNYVFIVEWKNCKRRPIATVLNGLVNIQIRLYEADMRIEVQYQGFASSVITTAPGSLGLRGATIADFLTRAPSATGAESNFYPTLAGATVGQTMSLRSNAPGTYTVPNNNCMFTWTPPCFNPTNLLANLQVDNTTVNFSWTAPAFATSNFIAGSSNYDWEVRSSGLPGSGATGRVNFGSTAATSASVTGLLPGVTYAFYVKSNCKPWTAIASTAGASSAGTTVTVNSTVGLTVGMSVIATAGTGVFVPGTTITSITSGTQFVVSVAPTTALSGGAAVTTCSIPISAVITPNCDTPVFPYTENFEGVVAPAIPNCATVRNTAGALMRTRDAASAILFPAGTPIGSYGGFANKNLITGTSAAADTWFFTRKVALVAGTTYKVSYKYGGSRELAQFNQKMKVMIGTSTAVFPTAPAASDMTILLADHPSIKTTPNTFTFHFVATATGNYHFGFNGYAAFNNGYLQIDDISVTTPTCFPPTALTSGAITYNSAILTWTPPVSAPSAGYEYYISTAATAPIATTTISGATLGTVNTFTGLASSTTYNVWVRSNCGGEYSAWSPVSSFTTLAPPPTPCAPAPTSVDSSGITNVTIGSINNTTGAEAGNYGNYTSLVTNIAQNTTVNMILRYSIIGFVGSGYYTRIWIDFNDNGLFSDAGETVFSNGGLELPNGVNNISFPVPAGAPLGQHRMRIGGADSSDLSLFTAGNGPCYTGSYGTFEDYSVFVTSPPPALTLSSPSTSFCNGGTSPLVTLNPASYSGAPAVRYDNFVWNPIAGVVGTPAGGYTFTPTNAGVNVYTLTATQSTFPFISNTATYTITVNDVPTPIVFNPSTLTVCEGVPTALTSGGGIVTGAIIFEENFNGATNLFTTVNNSAGGVTPAAAAWTLRTSPHVYGGRTFISNDASQFYLSNSDAQGSGGGSTTNTELISPTMSFVGYTNVSLSYWQFYQGFPAGTADTEVWSDLDNSGTINGSESWVNVQSFSTASSGALANFANITLDLSAYAGQPYIKIRFKYTNATWAWFWAVDNVKVTGSGPASLTWAPTTGLYTDTLGTIAYTGTPATTVYAKLSSDITYTATAASLAPPFCNTSSVLNITVTKAGTATGDQVVLCGNTTIASNISLTGYVPNVAGTITGWQMADNPAFSLATVVPGSAGKNILTPADVSGLSGTTYFRAMIVGCPALFSNTVTVSYPTVTWNGAWNPGPPAASDNVTVTSGTLNITSDLTICSLKINNNTTVTVQPGATLTVNGAVVVAGGVPGGTLDFLSDPTFFYGTASLMQNPGATTNANSGVAKYARWIKTRKFDYTYWSSPLNPSVLINVSPLTLGDKFLKFDSNAYVWTYPNPASTTMTPGVGYAVRGPQTFDNITLTNHKANFSGTPNNGDYIVQVYKNGTSDRNFLGNPYPSAISADLLMDGNVGPLGAAGAGTTFYFWTHNTQYLGGAYLDSDFAAYNRSGGVGTAPGNAVVGGNNATPDGIISAGQGFMVKTVTVTPAIGSPVTFRNSMRVGGNNLLFYRQNSSNEKSRIWLDYSNVTNAEVFKQILVGYIPNASNGYEDGFDGEAIDSGSGVGFYSMANDDTKNLIIQGRALPFDSGDLVPLGYTATAPSTYQIALSNKDGLFGDDLVGIYLEDTFLGVVHDLRQSPYQFVTEAGTFNSRFILRYNNGLLAVNPANFSENNVVVFKQNEQIHVETSLVKMKSVKVFDIQGRLVIEKDHINGRSVMLQHVGLANQVLMVQITSVDGVTVNKKIIF